MFFGEMSQARRRTGFGWVTFAGAVAQMRLPRLLASTSRPRCSHSRMKSSSNPPLRLWAKLRKTQYEQVSSGLPPKTDIPERGSSDRPPCAKSGRSKKPSLVEYDHR